MNDSIPIDERRLLAALLPDLRGYARFLARGTAEADDLVQEALVRALAALERRDRAASLRAWAFTILRNTFYEQARRRRTERRVLAQVQADTRQEAAPGVPQQRAAELSELQRHLYALPPLLREALVLVGAHGLDHEEAAAICGVPVGTMKARVSRARRRLADSLAPAAADP